MPILAVGQSAVCTSQMIAIKPSVFMACARCAIAKVFLLSSVEHTSALKICNVIVGIKLCPLVAGEFASLPANAKFMNHLCTVQF